MSSKFSHHPDKPKHNNALNAYYILCSAHEAASSFLDLFEKERTRRKAIGASTDEEQDLLRAMLVFACSGLDSMLKQLVLDGLPQVISKDAGAHELYRDYIEKKLKKGVETDVKYLASILACPQPQKLMMDELVYNIRSSSLQSKEQLLKVAAHFNIPSSKLTTDLKLLQAIFEARNQIAHEMDIDFKQRNRSRHSRKKEDMIGLTNEVFRISRQCLSEVDLLLEK
jgi:hypothetical protein